MKSWIDDALAVITFESVWGNLALECRAGVSMATKSSPPNAPSKTGNPSGGGRGNNPPSKGK